MYIYVSMDKGLANVCGQRMWMCVYGYMWIPVFVHPVGKCHSRYLLTLLKSSYLWVTGTKNFKWTYIKNHFTKINSIQHNFQSHQSSPVHNLFQFDAIHFDETLILVTWRNIVSSDVSVCVPIWYYVVFEIAAFREMFENEAV